MNSLPDILVNKLAGGCLVAGSWLGTSGIRIWKAIDAPQRTREAFGEQPTVELPRDRQHLRLARDERATQETRHHAWLIQCRNLRNPLVGFAHMGKRDLDDGLRKLNIDRPATVAPVVLVFHGKTTGTQVITHTHHDPESWWVLRIVT